LPEKDRGLRAMLQALVDQGMIGKSGQRFSEKIML
jgi:hypothetical protein